MRTAFCVILSLTSGCLLPPPIDEFAESQNRPPAIDIRSLNPDLQGLPVRLRCNSSRTFIARVTDRDNDTLYWRLFIDYDRDDPDLDSPIGTLEPNALDPSAPREIPLPSIDLTDPRFNEYEISSFPESTPHTLELFIADRPFGPDDRDPVGRTLRDDEGLTDSFVWPILKDRCPS